MDFFSQKAVDPFDSLPMQSSPVSLRSAPFRKSASSSPFDELLYLSSNLITFDCRDRSPLTIRTLRVRPPSVDISAHSGKRLSEFTTCTSSEKRSDLSSQHNEALRINSLSPPSSL